MRILLALSFLCLSACGPTVEPVASGEPSQAPEKASDTQMRDAIQAPIEKAKKVETQVIDGAEKQRADMEAAGG